MTDRIELLLDIARANELHDSTCQALAVAKAQRYTGAYLCPKPCDCWLSRPPGQEETAAAVDLRPDLPSPEELHWALRYVDEALNTREFSPLFRAVTHLRVAYEDLRWRMDELEK